MYDFVRAIHKHHQARGIGYPWYHFIQPKALLQNESCKITFRHNSTEPRHRSRMMSINVYWLG